MTRVLISGPPASGKSELAARLATVLDATLIDFDLIAQEMGSDTSHDHPPEFRTKVRAEIDRRLDALDGPAVVIRGAPTLAERTALAERIGADQVIVLDVAADEAKRRAAADGRPDWTAEAIDRWWRRYEPAPEIPPPAMGGTNKRRSAAMAGTPNNPPSPDPEDNPTDPPSDDLGDAGKKALEAERKARRDADQRAKELEAQLKEITDKDKSEVEKLREENAELTKKLADADTRSERLEVAMTKGLTAAQAKRLVGTTKEELEADADEILEAFPAKDGATPPPPSRRPSELRGGSDPTDGPDEVDPAKLAADVPRF